MKHIIVLFSALLSFSPSYVSAQGFYAAPFLLSGPSAYLEASGGAFTAMPANDAFGFYYNPAQLGQFSQNSNGALQIARRDWIPGIPETNYSNFGLSLGYNLKKINENLPLSIGMGYMLNYLSLGENVWTDETGTELGTYDSREYTNAFGLGLCVDFFLRAAIGVTYKRIVSKLTPFTIVGAENSSGEATANAFDFGLQINVPFTELFRDERKTTFQLFPVIEISYGYAIVNIGDEMRYIDKHQADPLPRQARLGNALKLGLGMQNNGVDIDLITIDYVAEANDLLANRNQSGQVEYQGAFGDIKFPKAMFLLDDPDKVTVRRGIGLNFFEMFQWHMGLIDQPYSGQKRPMGFAFNLRGVLKIISAFSGNPNLKNGLNHFDFQINYTHIDLNRDYSMGDGGYFGIAFGIYGF